MEAKTTPTSTPTPAAESVCPILHELVVLAVHPNPAGLLHDLNNEHVLTLWAEAVNHRDQVDPVLFNILDAEQKLRMPVIEAECASRSGRLKEAAIELVDGMSNWFLIGLRHGLGQQDTEAEHYLADAIEAALEHRGLLEEGELDLEALDEPELLWTLEEASVIQFQIADLLGDLQDQLFTHCTAREAAAAGDVLQGKPHLVN